MPPGRVNVPSPHGGSRRAPAWPGVVLIDVPMDVFSAEVPASVDALAHRFPTHDRAAGPQDGVAKAVDLLLGAQAPMIFAGNGINLSAAWDELRALAELTSTPVATTLTGKGVFPDSHPLTLGTAGTWGTRVANERARTAAVIVAVGTGFGGGLPFVESGVHLRHSSDAPRADRQRSETVPEKGLVKYAKPAGVIAGALPVTNPLVTMVDPRFDPYRADTRFRSFVKKVGLESERPRQASLR